MSEKRTYWKIIDKLGISLFTSVFGALKTTDEGPFVLNYQEPWLYNGAPEDRFIVRAGSATLGISVFESKSRAEKWLEDHPLRLRLSNAIIIPIHTIGEGIEHEFESSSLKERRLLSYYLDSGNLANRSRKPPEGTIWFHKIRLLSSYFSADCFGVSV